jgi:hypothetical protein
MLSSIEKRRLHEASLRPSSIDSRCNDARLHKFGSRAQTARNRTEQNGESLGVREGLTLGVFIGWPNHPWGDPIVSTRNPRAKDTVGGHFTLYPSTLAASTLNFYFFSEMLKFSKKIKILVQKSKFYDEKLKNLLSTKIKYFPPKSGWHLYPH